MPLSKEQFSRLPKEDQIALSDGKAISKKSFLALPAELQEELAGVKAEAKPQPAESFVNQASNALMAGYGPEVVAKVAKLAAPLYEKVTGHNVQTGLGDYTKIRDDVYHDLKKDEETNPVASGLGKISGTAVSLLPFGPASAGYIAKGGSTLARAARAMVPGGAYGAVVNPGAREGEVNPLQVGSRVKNAALGAVTGAATQGLVEGVPKGIAAVGRGLKNKAEKLAESATGATRVQAEKFQEGAGRDLLDKGLVKFADAPGDIAKRLESAIENAKTNVDDILTTLDDAGIKIKRSDLVAALKEKLSEVKASDAKAGVEKRLESIISRVESKPAKRLPSRVEAVKRDFQDQARRGYGKPNTAEAQKIAGSVFRQAVEDAAESYSPGIGKGFRDEKALERLAIPIRDAAQKRALQLEQSPKLGLLDLIAGFSGFAGGDPTFGVGTAIARRLVAPRVSSSLAVASNAIGKALEKTPEAFGQFAEPLLKSKFVGPQQFQAQVFKLIRDPEFRRVAQEQLGDELAIEPKKK